MLRVLRVLRVLRGDRSIEGYRRAGLRCVRAVLLHVFRMWRERVEECFAGKIGVEEEFLVANRRVE